MTRMKFKLKMVYRKIIHRFIVRYLISVGGAFHHGKYGENGRYVALMSDTTYNKYTNL